MLAGIDKRLAPQEGYIYNENEQLRVDQKTIAFLVGLMAFLLPAVLMIARFQFGWERDSISAYYYEHFFLGDIFVGILVFIGALLFTYRGNGRLVANLAHIAGTAAICVALFPTDGWICDSDLTLLAQPIACDLSAGRLAQEASGIIHLLAAAILFIILAVFCFFVFTQLRSKDGVKLNQQSSNKVIRNCIYYGCGGLIVTAIAAMGFENFFGIDGWDSVDGTFWAEAIALGAFGIAWMTNGRFLFGFLTDPDEEDHWRA